VRNQNLGVSAQDTSLLHAGARLTTWCEFYGLGVTEAVFASVEVYTNWISKEITVEGNARCVKMWPHGDASAIGGSVFMAWGYDFVACISLVIGTWSWFSCLSHCSPPVTGVLL